MGLVEANCFAKPVIELLLTLFSNPDSVVLILEYWPRARFTPTKSGEACIKGQSRQIAKQLQQRIVVGRDDVNAFRILRRTIEQSIQKA